MQHNIKENITKSLQAYLLEPNAQYAVLVSGKWGCGKTYFIKKQIESWGENIKETDEQISLKPIYVSLNGISTPSGLFHSIWKEIYPFLNSNGAKVLKLIFGGAIKVVSKCFIDLNGDGNIDDLSGTIDIESFIKLLLDNDKVIGHRILVFDDLERCLIPTRQLFGILNRFAEHSKCKVILIANEEKLEEEGEQKEQYRQIKEKLIGQTFKFDIDVSDSVSAIVAEFKNAIITHNCDLILDFFNASKLQNLRSLKTAIQSFCIFCSLIDEKFKKDQDVYQEFIKNVLAYFLICSFEISAGNTEIKEYQGLKNFLTENNEPKNKDPYASCINKHGIYSSHYSIQISRIYQFISNGFIDDVESIISTNMFYKDVSQKDWEKLWFYNNLENKDFLEYVDSVIKNICSKSINDISTLLHSAGVLLRLNNSKLIRINKKELLSNSKKTIDYIIQKAKTPFEETVYFSPESAYGKEYAGCKLQEFAILTSYCRNKLQKFQKQFVKFTCKKIWENLDENNVEEVNRLVFRRNEILGRERYTENIFCGVNLKIAANKISQLDNASKQKLSDIFFAYTSHSILPEEEKSSMAELSGLLKKSSTRYKLVDRVNINRIASRLDECVSKNNVNVDC